MRRAAVMGSEKPFRDAQVFQGRKKMRLPADIADRTARAGTCRVTAEHKLAARVLAEEMWFNLSGPRAILAMGRLKRDREASFNRKRQGADGGRVRLGGEHFLSDCS